MSVNENMARHDLNRANDLESNAKQQRIMWLSLRVLCAVMSVIYTLSTLAIIISQALVKNLSGIWFSEYGLWLIVAFSFGVLCILTTCGIKKFTYLVGVLSSWLLTMHFLVLIHSIGIHLCISSWLNAGQLYIPYTVIQIIICILLAGVIQIAFTLSSDCLKKSNSKNKQPPILVLLTGLFSIYFSVLLLWFAHFLCHSSVNKDWSGFYLFLLVDFSRFLLFAGVIVVGYVYVKWRNIDEVFSIAAMSISGIIFLFYPRSAQSIFVWLIPIGFGLLSFSRICPLWFKLAGIGVPLICFVIANFIYLAESNPKRNTWIV